jgi:hypothetical protein
MHIQKERAGTQAIVDDLVAELSGRHWAARRHLVDRIVTVEQVALSLLEGQTLDNGCLTLTDQKAGIVGEAIAAALRRLGVERAVCDDSAYVLSMSADRQHQSLARAWFVAQSGGGQDAPRPVLH